MHCRLPLLLLATMLVTACVEAASEATETTKAIESPTSGQSTVPDTPQAFIDAIDAAMVREGQVLHTTITATGGEVGAEPEDLWTDELWIYAAEDSARHLFHRAPENSEELDAEATFITVDDVTFDHSGGYTIYVKNQSSARDCPEVKTPSMVYVTLGLFCARYMPPGNEVGEITADIEPDATYEGQPAVALVYTARNEAESNATPAPEGPPPLIVSTIYASRESMLPLGWTVDIYATPDKVEGTINCHYTNEFIDRDELADDFFDPVTLIEPQPPVPLYWLGGEFDPEGELPLIALNEITLSQAPEQQPSYQVTLSYIPPYGSDPFFRQISIQQWASGDWNEALENNQIASEFWLYPCAESRSIYLEDGDATIFLTYEPEPGGPLPGGEDGCPDYEHDRFIGIVHLGDTVLLINGPFGNELHPRSLGDEYDPYNSLDGIQTIIEGFRPLGGERPVASSNPTESTRSETPTLEEVYAGLAATLAEAGDDMILHMSESTTGEVTGFMEMEVTIQTWVDASVPVARLESDGRWEYIEGEYVEEGITMESVNRSIILDRSEYRTSEGDFEPNEPSAVEAEGCYGQPEAIAIVIGCPGPTETSTTTVEWSEYEGQQALVLVTEGETRGSDEVTTFLRHTYLDPATLLPIFAEEEGEFNIGSSFPQSIATRYEHEFVERTALPADFFDLHAIGYTEPDHNALIDEYFDTPVYWLDKRFEPDGDLPPLVLSVVGDNYDIPPEAPNYDGTIHYTLADNPHGPGVIGMQLWPASEWGEGASASMLDGIAARPCNASEAFPIEGGKATIYHWIESGEITEIEESVSTPDLEGSQPDDASGCDTPGTTRYKAIVEFPETVIVIDAPGSSSPRDGYQPNPFNSEEGMRAIAEGLVLR